MAKDIHVLLVEDDPYARDLMALLLTRDWRTHVVGEAEGQHSLIEFLEYHPHPIDVVVLDTEVPGAPQLPFILAETLRGREKKPAILYTATRPDALVMERLVQTGFGGYVLKNEILYALGSAVAKVAAGNCVLSPGTVPLAARYTSCDGALVIDGRESVHGFTPRESELIRLGIIFNLSIRDMADELVLSPEWVSELVSKVYKKLGLRDMLNGELPMENYFDDPAVLERCRKITRRTSKRKAGQEFRKGPWMATLAFHLLTVPKIRER